MYYTIRGASRWDAEITFANKDAYIAWKRREDAKMMIDGLKCYIEDEERDLRRQSMAQYHGEIAERLEHYRNQMDAVVKEYNTAHEEMMRHGGII